MVQQICLIRLKMVHGSLNAFGQLEFLGVADSEDEEDSLDEESEEFVDPDIQRYVDALTDPSNQAALTDRLVKLHERMVKIQDVLYAELSDVEKQSADALDALVDAMDPIARKTVPPSTRKKPQKSANSADATGTSGGTVDG